MQYQRFLRNKGIFLLCIVCFMFSAFAGEKGDKIPLTTDSKPALEHFLKGRELFEKLQAQESRQHFEQAVAEDPEFALAYLFLSLAQPTAKGFFEQLNKAVALAEQASEGERCWILGTQAGVNGLPIKQREYFQKMVTTYPNDERAHTVLGNFYFGQQQWNDAIEAYKKATQINPNFSQPYNQLGYAYRFLADYENAEKTFEKYIELIPNDPNPYDSYAELLMKIGKHEKSIEHYKKALTVNPNFVASHIGIATNLNYLGKHEAARNQLKKLYEIARNDGERRAAHFASAVSYVHAGNPDNALAEIDKQYTLAEKINDIPAMAGDLNLKGNILLEAGECDQALALFEKSLKLIQGSNLAQEVKDNANRGFLYNSGRVAVNKNDLATAKTTAEKFHQAVQAVNNPLQMMLYHELQGLIALAEKDFEKAVAELNQANLQNPYNLYRLALAYQGKGDEMNSKNFCQQAAKFNALNNLNQGFIHHKTQKMLSEL